jgi:uncharacterized membrane protein
MKKGRLEAFSDGVIAIIITIMVLELKVPHGEDVAALKPLIPVFLSYVMSFIYIGIYWNNHHHLLQTAETITGRILWANLHLLFWLSLTPFITAWNGENHFAAAPMSLYGFVLMMAAVAYTILQREILNEQGEDSLLAKAVGKDKKGKISLVLYAASIPCAYITTWITGFIFIFVALMWLVPDKRIEDRINKNKKIL